jgi:glycosyltransferase involved in cell wall biosynthesis
VHDLPVGQSVLEIQSGMVMIARIDEKGGSPRPSSCPRTVMEDGMKLLALVESTNHVCCRYRIRAFESALNDAGWSLTCEGLDRGSLLRPFQFRRATQFDSVVLQRKLLPGWHLRALRKCSRHLVYDFDDAVLFRDSYDRRGLKSRWRSKRFSRTVCAVDTVVAGNDFLADCALRAGAKVDRVHVIPTCVDPRVYPVAQQESGASRLDLVWIGSASTLKGLEQSRSIWERLGKALPYLRLRVICDRFPERFPLPVVPVAWNEESEAREIAAGQIGVSWLPDDLWSRGKCGLKVLQYQAAGLPVIANPVGSHCEMIKAGETGFLATSADEWVAAAKESAESPRMRQKMGHLARERVESEYSISAWAETFVTSMTGTCKRAVRTSWKVDRSRPTSVSSGFEPHGAKLKTRRTLNQIGDR